MFEIYEKPLEESLNLDAATAATNDFNTSDDEFELLWWKYINTFCKRDTFVHYTHVCKLQTVLFHYFVSSLSRSDDPRRKYNFQKLTTRVCKGNDDRQQGRRGRRWRNLIFTIINLSHLPKLSTWAKPINLKYLTKWLKIEDWRFKNSNCLFCPWLASSQLTFNRIMWHIFTSSKRCKNPNH